MWMIFILIFLAALIAYFLKKIDLKGAIAGIILATTIMFGIGIEGLSALAIFFILGSLATSWEKDKKNQYNLAQENDGKRGIINVLANGGPAFILSILSLQFPIYQYHFGMMVMTSFAAACSDTLSSELGTAYGKKYFSIINFKSAKRGMDGAISAQGIIFGVLGSAVIGSISWLNDQNLTVFTIITISGFLGNLMDSVLGATWQKRGWLNNHTVNLLSICFAVFNSFILYIVL